MKKYFFFVYIALIAAVLAGCGALQNVPSDNQEKKTSEGNSTPVKVNLLSLQKINPSEIANIRFRFEKELVLTLINEPGNGVYKVNGEGNLVLLNDKTIKFPSNKLGKFSNPDEMVLRKDASFEITWEEESYDPELGASSLKAVYDDSLRVVIDPAGLSKGKPFVVYQKAKYELPADYKNYFLVVGEVRKTAGKVVSGVKTPDGVSGN